MIPIFIRKATLFKNKILVKYRLRKIRDRIALPPSIDAGDGGGVKPVGMSA